LGFLLLFIIVVTFSVTVKDLSQEKRFSVNTEFTQVEDGRAFKSQRHCSICVDQMNCLRAHAITVPIVRYVRTDKRHDNEAQTNHPDVSVLFLHRRERWSGVRLVCYPHSVP